MAINYNLLFPAANAGESFSQAFQAGIQNNRITAARQAMAALVQNPNNPQALAALAKVDPASAMQFREQQATLLKQQLLEHQDNIIKGAEILRQFNPKDQAGYTHALAAAQAAGIDISQVPQQFDQTYVDGVMKLADALKPDNANDPKYIPMTAGGGLASVDPVTGQARVVIAPNTSEATAGTPVQSAMPAISSPDQARQLPPGTQFRMPDGRIGTVPGGAGGNASGGFQ